MKGTKNGKNEETGMTGMGGILSRSSKSGPSSSSSSFLLAARSDPKMKCLWINDLGGYWEGSVWGLVRG